MKTRRLVIPFTLALGLTLALLWIVGTGSVPAAAAPVPSKIEGPPAGLVEVPNAPTAELRVCPAGLPDCDYDTIQAAVDAAGDNDVIKVATGIYTGVHQRAGITQVIYITKTVTIQGGYTTTNWTTPDPDANPTTLDARSQGRVIYATGSGITVTLEGLRITGGDATGLSGGYMGSDAGGGIYVLNATAVINDSDIRCNTASTTGIGWGGGVYLNQSTATLNGNVVANNTGSTVSSGRGGGVALYYSNDGTLSNNTIINNTASKDYSGSGGGLYMYESAATLTGNAIINNTASEGHDGFGGGMYLYESGVTLSANTLRGNIASTVRNGRGGAVALFMSDVMLTGNTIDGNTATTSADWAAQGGFGGGVHVDRSNNVTLTNNIIVNNVGGTDRPGYGGGVYLNESAATLTGNTVRDNIGSTNSHAAGGGLLLKKSPATLSGNTVQGNVASQCPLATEPGGGGLYLEESDATLTGNTVQGNVANTANNGRGGGLTLYRSNATLDSNVILSNTATLSPTATGEGGGLLVNSTASFTMTNNLVAGNHASVEGSGMLINAFNLSTSGRLLHTTIADNRGSGQGVFVRAAYHTTMLTFADTIIAGHDVGITATAGSTVALEATLWHNNGANTGGAGSIVTGATNVYGDPAFANPALLNYHITGSSAARDAGLDAGVTTDVDGESRDVSPDIGADEFVQLATDLALGKAASTGAVVAGRQVIYTLPITNGGPQGPAAAVVVDTFTPASAVASVSWSGGTCEHAGGVVTCTVTGITTAAPSTLTLYMLTDRTYSGNLTNNATLAGAWNTNDTHPANNSAGPVVVSVAPFVEGPRYADLAGGCNSLTPCYTSIGDAVFASIPGDTIYVFPDVYAESVDLSSMSEPGDVSLITVDTSGDPTTGTATVNPGAAGGPHTGDGIFNSVSPFLGNVTINGFDVASPVGWGINVHVNSDVVIANVTANGTAGDGIAVWSETGNVTVTNSTADENCSNGCYIKAGGDVLVAGSSADDNRGPFDGDGFDIEAGGDVEVTGSNADGNAQEGIDVDSAGGNAVIGNCNTNGNGGEGIDADDVGGNVSVADCSSNNNGSDGFETGETQVVGNVMVTNFTAGGNDDDGIDADADGNVTVTNAVANGNGGDGLWIDAGMNVIVTNAIANGSGDDGIDIDADGDVTIITATANKSGDDGININVDGDVTINGCTANNSIESDGFDIGWVGGNATVSGSTANGNNDDGFEFWETVGTVTIDASTASGNNGDGSHLRMVGGATVNGSIICNNVNGLVLESAISVDAEGNWWGDASGPTHPNNPGGSGDTISDSVSGGSGTVDFDPWIDTISAGPASIPANWPSVVHFQFSDAGSTVFLGLGPGDPNYTPPFTLTTDDGTLTSSTGTGVTVTEFVNGPNGVLTVTLTPTSVGTVTVTLDGPCNLDNSVAIQTYEPSYANLSIDKVASSGAIVAGERVTYTLTISNSGPVSPVDVVVNDTLSPAEAVGAVSAPTGCDVAGAQVTCNLSGLGKTTLEMIVTTTGAFSGTLTNSAVVALAGTVLDPDSDDNSTGPVTVTVTGGKNLIYLPLVMRNFTP